MTAYRCATFDFRPRWLWLLPGHVGAAHAADAMRLTGGSLAGRRHGTGH